MYIHLYNMYMQCRYMYAGARQCIHEYMYSIMQVAQGVGAPCGGAEVGVEVVSSSAHQQGYLPSQSHRDTHVQVQYTCLYTYMYMYCTCVLIQLTKKIGD